MSLPQHITRGFGGAVSLDLPTRPSTVTLTAETDGGAALVSGQAATVSSVATTLSAAASRGDTSITVADGTGISAGQSLWLQDDPEAVLVRKVSGTTVSLRRPVLHDHDSGATVEGTRCSYTISASDADTLFFDGRVFWTVDGERYVTSLECTEYPLRRLADAQVLFDIDPQLAGITDTEDDIERGLDAAHAYILTAIGARGRARVFTGEECFRQATGLAWFMVHYRARRGEDARELYERFRNELDAELGRITTTTPRDADQDGVVEPGDAYSFRSVRLVRR